MGYAQESGYTPTDINTIMTSIMENINVQFNLDPAYTMESFVGTSAYKYFYALAQEYQRNEVKTSEIFAKVQGYFDQINAKISRPVNTNPGIVEKMADEGYVASVKPMIEADAGKIHICVDVSDGDHAQGSVNITSYANLVSGTDDVITVAGQAFTAQTGAATPGTATFQAATSNNLTAESLAKQINSHTGINQTVRARSEGPEIIIYAIAGGAVGNAITLAYTDNDTNVGASVSGATLTGGIDDDNYDDVKLAICTLISQITVGGAVTQGTESEAIVLSNGQSFDFKYNLPNRLDVHLKLTIVLSENNQVVVGAPDDIKLKLINNINLRYKLGKNFEPQRYYSVLDAPWAASVLLEYSFDYDPDDGSGTWNSAIYDADYRDLFDVKLENIILVET